MKTPALPDVMDLVNSWHPDAVGIALGTGFYRFTSRFQIDGLARITDGDTIEFLALFAEKPGRGNFRDFMHRAQEVFPAICVWEVWNPLLEQILPRYGFKPAARRMPDGELLTGFKWTAPQMINPAKT